MPQPLPNTAPPMLMPLAAGGLTPLPPGRDLPPLPPVPDIPMARGLTLAPMARSASVNPRLDILNTGTVVEPPAPPPPPANEGAGFWSDTGNNALLGVNQLAQATRWLTGAVFGDKVRDSIDALGEKLGMASPQSINDRLQAKLSPEMQGALKKDWVTEAPDGKGGTDYGMGDAWGDWRAYWGGLVQSAPGTVLTMVPAQALAQQAATRAMTKWAISKEAENLYRTVAMEQVGKGASTHVAARAAETAVLDAAQSAAGKVADRWAMVAGGALEGLQQAGQSGHTVESEILAMKPADLRQNSEAFRSLAEVYGEKEALTKLARDAGTKASFLAGMATGIFGGQGDRVLAKLMRGEITGVGKRIGAGALAEGLLEEAPQNYFSQIGENVGRQRADPSIPTTQGALNQAAQGAAVGGLMGASFAAVPERRPESPTVARPGVPQEAGASAIPVTPPPVAAGLSQAPAGPIARAAQAAQASQSATAAQVAATGLPPLMNADAALANLHAAANEDLAAQRDYRPSAAQRLPSEPIPVEPQDALAALRNYVEPAPVAEDPADSIPTPDDLKKRAGQFQAVPFNRPVEAPQAAPAAPAEPTPTAEPAAEPAAPVEASPAAAAWDAATPDERAAWVVRAGWDQGGKPNWAGRTHAGKAWGELPEATRATLEQKRPTDKLIEPKDTTDAQPAAVSPPEQSARPEQPAATPAAEGGARVEGGADDAGTVQPDPQGMAVAPGIEAREKVGKGGAVVQPIAEEPPAAVASGEGDPVAKEGDQTKAEKEPASKPSSMPAIAEIPRDAVLNAYRWSSHTPERYADATPNEYRSTLGNAWKQAEAAAKGDPAALDRIAEVFKEVADGYHSRYMAYLGAKSRTASPMITGPANFQTERNRKRMESEHKRSTEASEYLARGIKRLLRAAHGPIDNSPAAELERVRHNLTQREEKQDRMKAANSAIRKGNDQALRDLDFTDEEIAKLKPTGFPDYKLKNNNAEIRRLRESLAAAERRVEATAAGPVESTYRGVRYEKNAQDDRLRLFFDGKPSEALRDDLKANAFKWSPKTSAWQRQLTNNAQRAAKAILNRHFPADVASMQTKALETLPAGFAKDVDVNASSASYSRAEAMTSDSRGHALDALDRAAPVAVKASDRPYEQAKPAAVIEDVGEKIGGARKDRWKERGMNVADLDSMSESEGAQLVSKAAVWKPDYAAMVGAGGPARTIAMIKIVYDSLAAKPKDNTPEGRRRYVKMMQAVREVYSNAAKYAADNPGVSGESVMKSSSLALREAIGIDQGSVEERAAKRKVFFSVYKGRSDPFSIGFSEYQRAETLVKDGFPGEIDPWKRRYAIRSYSGKKLTEQGVQSYVETASELGTPITTEQARGDLFWVTAKSSGKRVAILATFQDAEAAARNLYDRTKQKSGDDKIDPERPHLDNLPREGLPARINHEASADDFKAAFGFRGVEFGNWSAQDERQRIVSLAYDGLSDLARLLNVPDKAMSLNGTLGMAFGARGGGRFAAHYEPGKLVINLTKIRGGGSLAHEWAHAVDHYFGEINREDAYKTQARGASGWYSEGQYRGLPISTRVVKDGKPTYAQAPRLGNLRPEVAQAFDKVMLAIFQKHITQAEMVRESELEIERYASLAAKESDTKRKGAYEKAAITRREALAELLKDPEDTLYEGRGRSGYMEQAQTLGGKENSYWTRPTEMFARAFESYVFDRLTAMGAKSSYLVHGVEGDRFAGGGYKGNPYPSGVERARINAAFDKLFQTIRAREAETGQVILDARTASPGSDIPATIMVDGAERPSRDSTGALIHPEIRGIENFWRWWGKHEQRARQEAGGTGGVGESPAGGAAVDGERPRSLDSDGRPIRLYHGTADAISAFEVGHRNAKDDGWLGQGVYLTDSQDAADLYASIKKGEAGANVMPVYAALSNPYVTDLATKQRIRNGGPEVSSRWTESLKDLGFDGVIVRLSPDAIEVVAFDPAQVKSAIGNHGNFDRSTDISDSRAEDKATDDRRTEEDAPELRSRGLVEHLADRLTRMYQADGLPVSVITEEMPYKEGNLRIDPKGTVTVRLNPNLSLKRATQIAMHELVGHFGMRAIMPRPLWLKMTRDIAVIARAKSAALRRAGMDAVGHYRSTGEFMGVKVYIRPNNQDYATIDAVRLLYPEKDDHGLGDEVIARMAEQNVRPGFLKRVYAAVRQWLRRLGLPIAFNEADIRALLIAAAHPMRSVHEKLAVDAAGGDARTPSSRNEKSLAQSTTQPLQLLRVVQIAQDSDRKLLTQSDIGNDRKTEFGEEGRDGVDSRTTDALTGRLADDWPVAAQRAHNVIRDALTSGQKVSVWGRTIGTQLHKARNHPEFKKVYDRIVEFVDDTTRHALRAESMAPDILMHVGGLRDVGQAVKNALGKVGPTPEENTLLGRIFADGTLAGDSASPLQGHRWTEQELRDKYGASDRIIKFYDQIRSAADQSLRDAGRASMFGAMRAAGLDQSTIDAIDKAADTPAAVKDRIDRTLPDMIDQAKSRLTTARDAAIADLKAKRLEEWKRAGDDSAMRLRIRDEYDRRIQDVKDGKAMATKSAKLRLDALERLDKSLDNILSKTDSLIEHGYWPLLRFGKYSLTAFDEDGNVTGFWRSDSRAELDRIEREHKAEADSFARGQISDHEHELFRGVDPSTLALFAKEAGFEDEVIQKWYELATADRSSLKRMIHRKGTPGYSTDARRMLAAFITSNSRYSSTSIHSAAIKDAEMSITDGGVKDEAISLAKYVMEPNEEASALRGFLFTYYLGGSLASGLVNLTQPVLMTYPYVIGIAGGAAKAAGVMRRATAIALSDMRGKAPKDRTLAAALDKAKQAGIVEPSEIFALMAHARGAFSSPTMQALSAVWGANFAVSEAINRKITFVAAWMAAHETGAADPYEVARVAVYDTQGRYGKENRPNWARGAVGATLFTFKQFSIAYLEFLHQLVKQGKLPKRQLAAAALILLAGAGLQGLPFAEDMEDVFDAVGQWMGYATNVRKDMRLMARELLGDAMGDVALYGLSSLTGMDLSARIGLGNLIPGTGALIPSNKTPARDIAEWAGPVGGLATSAQQTLERLFAGQWKDAAESVAPLAVRNLIKGGVMAGTREARDSRGRKIADVDMADAVTKMVGFNPQSLASEARAEKALKYDADILSTRSGDIKETWARGIARNDPEAIAQARQDLLDWNRDNPDKPIQVRPADLMKRVRELLMSREQRFVNATPKPLRAEARQAIAAEKAR